MSNQGSDKIQGKEIARYRFLGAKRSERENRNLPNKKFVKTLESDYGHVDDFRAEPGKFWIHLTMVR